MFNINLIGGTLLAALAVALGALAWWQAFDAPVRYFAPVAVAGIVAAKIAMVRIAARPFVYQPPEVPFPDATDGWNVKYNKEFLAEHYKNEPDLRFAHNLKRWGAGAAVIMLLMVMMSLEFSALGHYYAKTSQGGETARIEADVIAAEIAAIDAELLTLKAHHTDLTSKNPKNQIATVKRMGQLNNRRAVLATNALNTRVSSEIKQGFFEAPARIFGVQSDTYAKWIMLFLSLTIDAIYLALLAGVKLEKRTPDATA